MLQLNLRSLHQAEVALSRTHCVAWVGHAECSQCGINPYYHMVSLTDDPHPNTPPHFHASASGSEPFLCAQVRLVPCSLASRSKGYNSDYIHIYAGRGFACTISMPVICMLQTRI